jgi:hypothetical protein
MKKINLSVPDDLAAKIEHYRGYLGNLSLLFQQAVTAKIMQREEFNARLEGDAEMSEIIERLQKEKAVLQGNYLEKGREEGLRWAKAASYKDLEYARRFDPTDRKGVYDPTISLHDDVLGFYFADSLFADKLTNPEWDEEELNIFAKQWMMGWIEAVKDFWIHVEPKL